MTRNARKSQRGGAERRTSTGGIENYRDYDSLIEGMADITCASPCTPPPVGCDDAGAAFFIGFQKGIAGVSQY